MAKSLWEYSDLIKLIAEELFNSTSDYEREIYDKFFIPRASEENQLYSIIKDLEEMGSPKNVLIIGDRGVGKSCFLEWFLTRSDYSDEIGSGACFLELGPRVGGKDESALVQLIQSDLTSCMKKFLNENADDPCNEIPDKFSSAFELNNAYNTVCAKFQQLGKNSSKCMNLFIDDIDYIDVGLLPLLIDVIRPLLILRSCRVILAARKPAYNTVMGHSDVSMAAFFGGGSHSMELAHLDVDNIIKARLHFVCSDQKCSIKERYESEPAFYNLFKKLGDKIWQLFVDPKLPKQENVETIRFPFTENQCRSIQNLSNGNITYVLEMCKEYLRYMRENPKEIKEGIKGYHIGREGFLNHFTREDIWGRIRIQNIHRRKSHQFLSRKEIKDRHIRQEQVGNSLYVVLLEALAQSQSINATRISALEGFGFSEREVNEGIDELLDMEMIEEQKIIDNRPLGGGTGAIIRDMKITKRGEYYLWYMMHWSEYIKQFSYSEHHRRGLNALAKESMRAKILELTVAVILTREEMGIIGQDFKVSKKTLWQFYSDMTEPVRVMLDMTSGGAAIPLTEKDLDSYLKELGIITTKRLAKMTRYLIYYRKVEEQCEKKGVPWKNVYMNTNEKEKIRAFTESYVVTPDYGEGE